MLVRTKVGGKITGPNMYRVFEKNIFSEEFVSMFHKIFCFKTFYGMLQSFECATRHIAMHYPEENYYSTFVYHFFFLKNTLYGEIEKRRRIYEKNTIAIKTKILSHTHSRRSPENFYCGENNGCIIFFCPPIYITDGLHLYESCMESKFTIFV